MKSALCLATLLILTTLTVYSQQSVQPASVRPNYPLTSKTNQTDDYFGTRVTDSYRWLENDTAANVVQWVEAENKVTQDYLDKIPFREKIKERLTNLFNYPKYSSPFRVGDYYIFSKNNGLQN